MYFLNKAHIFQENPKAISLKKNSLNVRSHLVLIRHRTVSSTTVKHVFTCSFIC